MANKRKTTTAIVAGVTAAALLLGGTFAWTSISQQAKNETAGIVNVGGRLHDDFNGTNKDVYVENFTDPLNGGQPIYARIRLDEYMEVGSEAGQADNANRKADPVVADTDINDVKTWTPHVPSDSCEICATTDTCKIHDHWEWEMGGQTTFMPTFNKDKDSLAADINGTYAGTNKDDKIYYDDYVVYTTDNTTGGTDIAEADKESYDGKIYSIVGTEYYDDDTDTEDNNGTRQVDGVTHTAKQTAAATVMTMQDWIDGGKLPGNYWVYDTDGWAYWANPIMPGEATGLLLSNIEMYKNPGEKCYYAINVVGQFATVNDWEYFTDDAPTAAAQELLQIASNNVTTVTVTNNGATTLSTVADEEAGTTNTTTFTATASKPSDSTATAADPEFTWAVYDADLNPVETSNITIGDDGIVTLTVGESETNKNLIIAATHTASGAVGLASVAIDSPVVTYRLAVSGTDEYYQDLGGLSLESDYTVTLTANDKPLTISEVVSVEVVGNSNSYTNELSKFAGSATLQDDGTVLLTVGTEDEELGTGNYAWNDWKIIKLTVKDSEGTEYSRPLLINAGTVTYNQMVFRNMDGSLATVIDPSYVVNNLTINTMYTFEPGLYSQSQNFWNNYLDSVWFDDGWTVTAYEYDSEYYEAGAEATSVTIKDNTIIFTETGEYVIEAVKDGYETVSSNVTVNDPTAFIEAINNITTVGMTETVTIDGESYYVMAKEDNRALLIAETETEQIAFDAESTGYLWAGSDVRAYLNGEWLASNSTLNRYAIPTTIMTNNGLEKENQNVESTDRVFLPSSADVNCEYNYTSDYTCNSALFTPENFSENTWTRSTDYGQPGCVASIDPTYTSMLQGWGPNNSTIWIRPMLWISLDATADYSDFTITVE